MGFPLNCLPVQYRVYSKLTLLKKFPSRKFLLCIFALPLSLLSAGQQFTAATIPDSLKENADVVIRLDEISNEIKSTGRIIVKERHVYTILNEKGEYYANYKTYYNDKTVIINSVNGYLYDASGKELRHFRKKDMEDHPVFDGSSFVNDERLKIGNFYSHSYPYTVEFDEEDEKTEFFNISDWHPQGNASFSVEKSVYRITAPADYELRFKMLHATIEPAIEKKLNNKIYSWEIRNLTAYSDEPYSNVLNSTPRLMVGLSDVEMGGYKGSMNTWNDYAKFYGSLQKGRDVLPDETKQKVHELTAGLTDPQAKIAVLYNYLQQNTHYVGIQLGIGGWQTYDAKYVATNKYGDCKALSNFMISLLKEAGIRGNAVVIRGGQERMDFIPDFINDPFNHVICCVPLGRDTVWLECTSQSLPPGYLSEFTANRFGLLIDDNGGSLVHTPAYLIGDNVQIRKISASLDNEGNLNLEAKTSYKAICQDDIESFIHGISRDEQLKRLKSEFDLPTYEVLSFDYQEDHTLRLPVIHETIQVKVINYAQVTGKRIFINPDILNRSSVKLADDKDRRLSIELREEYKHIDSVQIAIPSGYEIESKAMDLVIDSKFGKYIKKTVVSADKIIYVRILEQRSGRFPPEQYGDFVKFYKDIYAADRTSIVLVKKN